MIPLKDRILQLISGNDGIKASRLCAELSVGYVHLLPKDIRWEVITMIANGEIVEIEYTLPNHRNESLLLPKGSEFKGVSK